MNFKLIEFLIVFMCALVLNINCDEGKYTSTETDENDCPSIISRRKWGSKDAKTVAYQTFPVKYVIIHHTVTPRCETKLKCSNRLLGIQNYHMNEKHGDDIPYNFLVGDNGVYEGTGWHVKAGTSSFKSNSTGIAFVGDFSEVLPTDTAIHDAKQLIECGIKLGEIDSDYILLGARQVIATESPGLELYTDLQDWDHWKSI